MRCRTITWAGAALLTLLAAAAAEPETIELGRGAWGRIESLGGARWLMVVTRFATQEPSRLEFLLSEDNGRHWHSVSELRETGRQFDNGHLLRLPHGNLLLSGRSLVDERSYHLPVYASTNQGRSWQKLSNVDASEGQLAAEKKGLWEPFLFLLPDGRVSVIYSNEKHPGFSQLLSQKTSPDGGRTWGAEQRIVEEPGGGKLRPGMGVVTRLPDGRFFLVYEVVGMGRGLVHYKISSDGEQWPPGLGTPIEGHEAAPYAITLKDGRLLLTSCHNTLSISQDQGRSWKPLAGGAWPAGFLYTWPALYETEPGRVLIVHSWGGLKLRWLAVATP